MTKIQAQIEIPCPECDGVGQVKFPVDQFGHHTNEVDKIAMSETVTCSDCDGEGTILEEEWISISELKKLLKEEK